MITKLINFPFLKRLIPSIITRYYRITKKSRKYYQIGNINFFLDFLDPMDREIILNKNYEYDQVFFIEKKMKNDSFSHFIDVGANSGYYSFYFASKFKDIKIKSFEPNKDACKKFLKTLKKNSIKNIELFNFGLSNIEKKVQATSLIRNGHIQSNLTILESEVNRSALEDMSNLKIKKLNLKNIVVKIGDNILNIKNELLSFKIDVEGHEIYTLKGLVKTFKDNKCLILIEIFDWNFYKVNKFFQSINYKQIHFFKNTSYYIFSNINYK